jgi:hypothetical protein
VHIRKRYEYLKKTLTRIEKANQCKEIALRSDFRLIKLTEQSIGQEKILWTYKLRELENQRRRQEVAMVVDDMIQCIIESDGCLDASRIRTIRTTKPPQQRRTFYMCSGGLRDKHGVCRSVHCNHSGRQEIGITLVKKDIEKHVNRVHRVQKVTDGYENCGFLAPQDGLGTW